MRRYYVIYESDTKGGKDSEQIRALKYSAIKAIEKLDKREEVIRLDVTSYTASGQDSFCFGIGVKIYINGQSPEVGNIRGLGNAYEKMIKTYLGTYPKELFRYFKISFVIVKCVWIAGGSLKSRCWLTPKKIGK